jgi:uncharacterized protein with GYD domain
MPKYVSLISWTEQGIANYKDTVSRAKAAQQVAADLGGSLEVHWTVGPYDIVALSEFPDDEAATAFLLKVGSLGSIRTTTMRSFDQDDIARIIAKT